MTYFPINVDGNPHNGMIV